MEYDGSTDTLCSMTRKGANLEYDKHGLVKACEVSYLFEVPEDLRERHPHCEYVLHHYGSGLSEMFETLKEARSRRAF